VSWLDGYQIRQLALPADGIPPIYENRSGQLWSLYLEGVMDCRRDEWIRHPLAELGGEQPSARPRPGQPVPLLPAERDSVFLLLPDRLLKYEIGQGRVQLMRRAAETRLEAFTGLVEARDGGAWILGRQGLAKLPGPIRRTVADTPWSEHPLPEDWQLRPLGRPMEDEEGGVTAVAESDVTREAMVVRFEGALWTRPIPAPAEARLAWRGIDGTVWCLAQAALHSWNGEVWEAATIPGLSGGRVLDVATEPGGAFWLATTEGLIRHSLRAWQPASESGLVEFPVHDITEDAAGHLWFASARRLVTFRDGSWGGHDWPPGFALESGRRARLFVLPDRRLVVDGNAGVVVFDPASGGFDRLPPSTAGEVRRALGQSLDGGVFLLTGESGTMDHWHLVRFDGRDYEPFFEGPAEWNRGFEIAFLQAMPDGSLWLGGTQGLRLWDERTRTFADVPNSPTALAPALLSGARGRIWCGSGDAVLEYDGKTWSVVRRGFGQVNALRRGRDGSVWVASANGVHRLVEGSWVGNGGPEGVRGEEVWNVWPDQRGATWLATPLGLYRYHREADLDSPRSLFFSGDDAREVSTHAIVRLDFGGRDKWDYTAAKRLLFARRLDDNPWSPYEPITSVLFTNLAAGKHRLAVRAMDRNGNEEPEPTVFEFTAIVPWYAEPRLLGVGFAGVLVAGLLASLAINRHLRLRRSYAEVERIVTQRTQELERANQELLHSQKMKALGTLAAGIAHDFNSILSIIKGSAQIIGDNLDDKDKVRTRLGRILGMVDQGAGIVKAMLGLSRPAALEATPCDLNQMVVDTIRALGDQFPQELTLVFDPPAELPTTQAVPDLVRQMLVNLILNAADALNGRGEIELRTGQLPNLPPDLILPPGPAERFLFVSVRDQGPGIPPEILPRIFEPFFTTKALSTKRGTGLGLTMVYEIARESGLGLRVESTPGRGSTFTILLPVARNAAAEA